MSDSISNGKPRSWEPTDLPPGEHAAQSDYEDRSLPPYPGRGELMWGKGNAFVYRNMRGGLTYSYLADRCGDDPPRCEFSLFSEVGEPYRAAFDEFFARHETPGIIDYADSPHLADHLRHAETP